MVSVYNNPVNKIRHYVFAYSLNSLVVNLVLNKWYKQTLCVRSFDELVSGSFCDCPVDKTRHYMLAILMYLFRDNYIWSHWMKADTMC